jgi:hypothetical protein
MIIKNKNLREISLILFLTLIAFNGLQSYDSKLNSNLGKVYLLAHFFIILFLLIYAYKNYLKKGVLYKIVALFFSLTIPNSAKIIIIVIFIGNFISIGLAKSYYPFYEVGMFRWSSKFSNPEKIVYKPKYYYYLKKGEVKILDLRKESIYLFSEHLGWGYTHEFTFASTYHNKRQKENFEFIAQKMKERDIDTLWVGVHSVDYSTGEVKFDPNICNAIEINENIKIHYGPIYIPEYQKLKCENEN